MESTDGSGAGDAARTIRTLAKAAGFQSYRKGRNERLVPFIGRTREWNVIARCDPERNWLNMYVMVCELPKELGIRGRLFDAVMAANARMSLTKFIAASGNLVLDLDYRMEHVDATVFGNLIGLLHGNAEEHYPKVFRTVSGDDVLEALTPAATA